MKKKNPDLRREALESLIAPINLDPWTSMVFSKSIWQIIEKLATGVCISK